MGNSMSTKIKAGTASSGAVLDADTTGILELQSGSTPTTAVTIDASQNVGVGTASPTAKLDVLSDIFRLRTAKTPATAGASGNAGDVCWDAGYVYVCVATNTWKKCAISTW